MKRGLNININFSNRVVYTLIIFLIFLVIGVGVFAFGTSDPSNFGHSASELDFSGGIDGDIVFRGNIDVLGSVKIGTSVTCGTNEKGTLRFTGTEFQGCNGTSWGGFGGVSTSLDTLLGGRVEQDCTDAGGEVVDVGSGGKICKFIQSACPTGWAQYSAYSTTEPNFCKSYSAYWGNYCTDGGCTTGSHDGFWPLTQETCSYDTLVPGTSAPYPSDSCTINGGTCFATIIEIGCT